MIFSIKERIYRPELMDDHDLSEVEMHALLKDLSTVNSLLGGNKVTVNGIKKLLKGIPKEQEISIADIGCGNGTVLREIAAWGRKNNYRFNLVGIDNNATSIKIAQTQSKSYREIEYLPLDVLSSTFEKHEFDIITTTLTLHHFTNEEIKELLKKFVNQSRYGVVINDLERNLAAYYLFYAFSEVFLKTDIAKKDGLTSILRAFKKEELLSFANKLEAVHQEIKWFWAFRYQWIIFKNERKNTAGK